MKRSNLQRRTELKRGAGPQRKTAIKKKSGHKHEKEALDKLARAIIFARDPKCQKCGKTENGQWCHVSSRRYISVRWRLENSLRLCAGCHLWWHHKPLESARWFEEKFPDRAKALRFASQFKQKVDLKLVRLHLMAEATRYNLLTPDGKMIG